MKKVFIATAMSGLSKEDYSLLRNSIIDIKNKNPQIDIFSEITNIENQKQFLSPKEATENDINEILKAEHFILFHLSNVQSSTLFELGIAFADKKRITIFYKEEKDLPFMVRELDLVSAEVSLIHINSLNDKIILEKIVG